MKYLYSIIFLFFIIISSKSQTLKPDSILLNITILEQVNKMGSALLRNDLKEFVKYLDPEMIKLNGGENVMIETIKQGINELKTYGDSIIDVNFNKPSKIIKINGELQCTLPQIIVMKVPNGKLITKSTLIGVSKDMGRKWFFIDCSGRNIETLINIFPSLSKNLIIEKESQPVFFKDK